MMRNLQRKVRQMDQTDLRRIAGQLYGSLYWARQNGLLHWSYISRRQQVKMAKRLRVLNRAKRWVFPEKNARGNLLVRQFVGQYEDKFVEDAILKGFHYFQSFGLTQYFVDPVRLEIKSFSEGDMITVSCANRAHLELEMSDILRCHDVPDNDTGLRMLKAVA